MQEDKFKKWVREAIESLPVVLRKKLYNVEITVEDSPRGEIHKNKPLPYIILGLYQGVPLNKRGVFHTHFFPDRITIFCQQIEKLCASEEEMRELVIKTTLHEIGHYFGFNERELREMEITRLRGGNK